MLEAAGSFAEAVANTIVLSRHGEAELLLGLVVGLAFLLDLLRGRDPDDHHDNHPAPLNHHPR